MSTAVRPCAACGRPAMLWRCTPCILAGRMPTAYVEDPAEPAKVHAPSTMPLFGLCGAYVGPGGDPVRRVRVDLTCTDCLATVETIDQRPGVRS